MSLVICAGVGTFALLALRKYINRNSKSESTIGEKSAEFYSKLAVRLRDEAQDEAQDEVQDEVQVEEQDEEQDEVQDKAQDEAQDEVHK